MGSKAKLAKFLVPIIEQELQKDQWYVEPFVGGANLIDKINSKKKIGNDNNKYLIALLKAAQKGYVPPTNITKEFYYEVKKNMHLYPKELVGFVGVLCSFGAKWFDSYARGNNTNYAASGSRAIIKQSVAIKGIKFCCKDFRNLKIPDNSLIYCDPPYANTTKYKSSFNNDLFWVWCREKVAQGHNVFISEYNAPKDFECILEIKHKSIMNKNKPVERIEKLFKLKV